MANVAIIQGSSRGLGKSFVQALLKRTSLQVVSTTSSDPSHARSEILSSPELKGKKEYEDRLTSLKVDVLDEGTIEKAARDVEGKFGKGTLRLLINTSGILKAEKSITKVSEEDLLLSFRINTFGHILTFKHFLPLLPSKSQSTSSEKEGGEDSAKGVVKSGLSVLASMSARVGSIGDNERGGWYSYRSSKSATNQVIQTLHRELSMRSSGPTIALALHPGTVAGTDLSGPFSKVEDRGKKEGVFGPDESVEKLLDVISRQGKEDSGKFLDWKGEIIPW